MTASATVILVRHAAHAHLGNVLSGRMPGVPLCERGRQQASALASSLRAARIDFIETSPTQRARETAQYIAQSRAGLEAVEAPDLDEVDFGEWTGESFAALAADPRWDHWNQARSQAQAPGGETMAAVQDRAWLHIKQAARRAAGTTQVMVSHCDVIRAVVARVLGMPLESIFRFDVDPASLTRIEIGEWGAKLVSLNERPYEVAA